MKTYKINSNETYIYLVRENIELILDLINQSSKQSKPFDPNNLAQFYKSRTKHLQTMAVLGLTYEHLLKRIILKRGFSVFVVNSVRTVKGIDQIKYSNKTISFKSLIKIFLESNVDEYFEKIKTYEFNTQKTGYQYEYLGYKKIDPSKFIFLIQSIRNNYVHDIDSHSEWNGLIWYSINYLIWLAKKEFPKYFSEYDYIGNQDIVNLFK